MSLNNIFISKRKMSEIIEPKYPCFFRASDFSLGQSLTGKNVKIAVLDSGVPNHTSIADPEGFVNFVDTDKDEHDKHGHSTMVSGIMAAKDKNFINGISPGASYYYGKIIDSQGKCDFNRLIGAILWATVREVDIILLAIGTKTDYSVLHDAIKKAFNSNICIVAAAGHFRAGEDVNCPARYNEVISVDSMVKLKKNKTLLSYGNTIELFLNKRQYTTFLGNKYIECSGNSIAAAYAAGLLACLLEKKKSLKEKIDVVSVYKEFMSLKYNPSNIDNG